MVGTLARVLRTGPRLESVGAATQTEDRTVQRNDVSFFEAMSSLTSEDTIGYTDGAACAQT